MGKKGKVKRLKKPASSGYLVRIYFVLCLFILLPAFIGLFVIHKTNNTCANSISCIKDLSGKPEEGVTQGIFLGKVVSVPTYIADTFSKRPVLGETTAKKLIKIDLSSQHLYAYEDNRLVYNFPVSTGKWGKTPTGTFHVWIKLRATRMTGGQGADFYDLANVPYTMFFSNNEVGQSRGFSIHGAYWHNNFGHTMSHGCVNMRTEDASVLFNWADPPTSGYTTHATKDNPGTEIAIYGEPPTD